MKRSSIKNLSIALLLTTLFSGCGETNETVHHRVNIAKKGYLVAPLEDKITYKCGGKSSYLNSDGMFQCQSFPVTFYVDSKPIGSINSLHSDGYVFPQDMIPEEDQERGVRVASW